MRAFVGKMSTSRGGASFRGEAVPTFDPEDRDQDVEMWLRKMNDLRDVFRWSEEATIYHALSKLRGLAETWYKGLRCIKLSWADWQQQLLKAFPPSRDFHQRLEEMFLRKKRMGESYSKYYYEKMVLINACKVTGTDAVSCLIGGIQDSTLKNSIRAADYQRPEDLLQYFRSLPGTSASTERNTQPTFGRRVGTSASSLNRACHVCRSEGHIAKFCPKRRGMVCNYCRKEGHQEVTCLQKARRKDGGNLGTPLTCNYCRKEGHQEATCLQKARRKDGGNLGTPLTCSYCHKKGHSEATCFRKQGKSNATSTPTTL
ncbi:uncharacterized protein LOC116165084 [Photinus pyralis]|uniref:uncharacterized protein LOC116165084 n=1 Tax=Photinus pyralis TaxID=7054 RepID=UPI0012672806|nr:uncharacterized protein LOC116165084 [Photinus pyralis]